MYYHPPRPRPLKNMDTDLPPLTMPTDEEIMAEETQEPHVHGPFTFLLNQNHNALRGCITCGQTWVGVMAGPEDDIRWHVVQEPPEEA